MARLGSVSRAADELHLTQPAVSIQIGALEESAGTPLLQRAGRGMRLTEAGELLAGYAGAHPRPVARGRRRDGARCSGVFSGTLRVGAVTTAEYLLPPLLVTFANQQPEGEGEAAGRQPRRDRAHARRAGDRPGHHGPAAGRTEDRSRPRSRKHPMAFLAAPQHPLMRDPRPGDRARWPSAHLLVRERGSGTRTTVERLFKDAGVPLRIGSELSSNEAIKQMCAAGFGVAFLSLHTCVLELTPALLALLPLAGQPDRARLVRDAPGVAPAAAGRRCFRLFLTEAAQEQILRQLGHVGAPPAGAPKRRARRRAPR